MCATMPAGTFASAYTRGLDVRRSACGASSEESVPIRGAALRFRLRQSLLAGSLRFSGQIGNEPIAVVDQFLSRPPAVGGSDGVFAEERKRDRRVAVGDDGVGQHA